MERALHRSGLPARRRRRLTGHSLVLAYHNVVPDSAPPIGDRSLHLRRSEFGAQLDRLARTHDIVPLGSVFQNANTLSSEATPRRPRAAITFDDAYVGALTLGLEELNVRKLPATVFVSPGLLGEAAFWWDLYAEPRSGLRPDLRLWALEEQAGVPSRIFEHGPAPSLRPEELPSEFRPATERLLEEACERADVTLGSHGWDHANLGKLSGPQVGEQLGRSIAWLGHRFGATRPWVAYPYGICAKSVRRAAAAAGFRAGFLVRGGWLPPEPKDFLRAPRVAIPSGLSREGFTLRTAGMFCR